MTDLSNSPLQPVLDALQEAVFVLDENRNIIAANPAAEALFSSDLAGQDFVKIMRHPNCISAIKSVLAGEKDSQIVVANDNPGTTLFQIKVTRIRNTTDKNSKILLSLRDISDVKEAEQMRTDFVANVSHELRSPLTALSGFIETLADDPAMEPEARARFLDLMDTEANRMVRLIADLLSLSKVEAQQRRRPRDIVDLEMLINRVMATLQPHASKEDKELIFEVLSDTSSVMGDADELTQVFQNLIENAIKYGKRNSIVSIKLDAVASTPNVSGPAISVEILDEGEGFSPHHIPRLTERFYRVDTHRSRDKGGTGLGLAIVKHIINRHRGRLKISSIVGKGSRFIVILPMAKY